MKASHIAARIEACAPKALAESWDNPGFQIGSPDLPVERVLLTLDVTPETITEAVEKGAQMIVAHHPFFFKGLKQIDTDTAKGKMIRDALKNDIVVYAAHTNIDKAAHGLSDYVAARIGLEDRKPLVPEKSAQTYCKLVVYAPREYAEAVARALGDAGAGATDALYSHCTFRAPGQGTFMPLEGAKPFTGETNTLATVDETRVETVVDKKDVGRVLSAVRRVHPYEVFAYDLFPVEIRQTAAQDGLGVIGRLAQKESAAGFAARVKKALDVTALRSAGPVPETVRTVALCTGSGAEFIELAKKKGADVYITGDLKHHDAQRAAECGLWVLDAGHYGTEKHVTALFEDLLNGSGAALIVSEKMRDYVQTI